MERYPCPIEGWARPAYHQEKRPVNRFLALAVKNPLAVAIGLLALFLAGWLVKTKWDLHKLEQAHIEATTQRDSLAAEAAAARAEAQGWSVQFATATEQLWKQIASREESLAALTEDFRASGIRITRLTSIVASLEGQISSAGTPAAVPDSETDPVPPSWSGEADDGVLRLSWTFWRFAPRLTMDYGVVVPIELIEGESGDGRTLVLARTRVPNATLTFEELLVDRQPPIVVEHCSVGTRLKWGLGGLGVGFAGGSLAPGGGSL